MLSTCGAGVCSMDTDRGLCHHWASRAPIRKLLVALGWLDGQRRGLAASVSVSATGWHILVVLQIVQASKIVTLNVNPSASEMDW